MDKMVSFILEADDGSVLDLTNEIGDHRIEVVGIRDKANLPVICEECSKKSINKMLRRIAFVIDGENKLRGRICVECGRSFFKNKSIKQLPKRFELIKGGATNQDQFYNADILPLIMSESERDAMKSGSLANRCIYCNRPILIGMICEQCKITHAKRTRRSR